ncbi:MAG: patatin-like phospholipase family protein [Betaproteobacteria bacterium]
MTSPADPVSSADVYSPRHRTAVVLTGTGTAGAYHAGALRALHEAGVKVDLVAGRGIGVVGALFAAVDGAHRLWDERGFWRASAVRSFYEWHRLLRVTVWALAASLVIVVVPIAAVALGLLVYPIDFFLKIVGVGGAGGLVAAYLRLAEAAFAPQALPTWLPRLVLLVLGVTGALALASGWIEAGSRRPRGAFWWRMLAPPLSSASAATHCWRVLWDLLRGAAQLRQPPPLELGRRYTELLAENLGQPGFRELMIAVHDLDAHRDLVFALVGEPRRRALVRRPTSGEADARRAEIFDLQGVGRDYLADAVAAALRVPVATGVHAIRFAPDAYWRGETHRLCDRPAALLRLLAELAGIGVEQAIVVSSAPEIAGPHALSAPRVDGRGRLGEYLQSDEAAVVRDAVLASGVPRLFVVRPDHNPVGPFDFSGGHDERSARRQPLSELMSRGYEDAYRQFIEPVVGASGDRVGVS